MFFYFYDFTKFVTIYKQKLNKNMKSQKRLFNFCLPDDLKDYIKTRAEIKKTTLSHYMVNLIVEDKEKQEEIEQKKKS